MEKKINRFFSLTVVIMMLGVNVFAQGKVDFSGKWKINESKSKFNPERSFHPEQVTITQSGNNLTLVRVTNFQGESRTMTEKFTLDGKECTNTGFRDRQTVSTATWSGDGKSLNIKSKTSMDNGDMTMERKLSMDGKNFVLDSNVNSPRGESHETWVFDKQ